MYQMMQIIGYPANEIHVNGFTLTAGRSMPPLCSAQILIHDRLWHNLRKATLTP